LCAACGGAAAPGPRARRTDNPQERDPPGAALIVEIHSGTGLVSGIVYDGSGYIMTNAHV
jgi:S1-C subfamily serine protease